MRWGEAGTKHVRLSGSGHRSQYERSRTPCLPRHPMRALGTHSARGAVAVAGSWRTGASAVLPAFDAHRSSSHARRRAESALLISMMMVSFRLVERLERHPDIARAFLTLQAMPCVAALAVIDLTATWYRVGCSACTVYAQIRGQARGAKFCLGTLLYGLSVEKAKAWSSPARNL